MLEEYCGWTRNIDWGTAPAWLSLMAATLAALLAFRNLKNSQATFAKSVADGEVAQARLVYAYAKWARVDSSGSRVKTTRGHVYAEFENELLVVKQQDPYGQVIPVASRDLAVLEITIVNSSTEPVTSTTLMLTGGDFGNQKLETEPAGGGIILPGTERKAWFAIANSRSTKQGVTYILSFTDSAGKTWVRENQKPVTKLVESVSKRTTRQRAAAAWAVWREPGRL